MSIYTRLSCPCRGFQRFGHSASLLAICDRQGEAALTNIMHSQLVDEFARSEVELDDEQQVVNLPAWAAEEVTLDARYYNNQLMQNPVADW